MDAHYTPPDLARSLVAAANDLSPRVVADLAAGGGDLLVQAEKVWPAARFVATNVDRAVVRRLARAKPSWMVGRCDLRNAKSRNSCHALRRVRGAISLLLLNPPFSCRGGTTFSVSTPDGSITASTAMSFLLLAKEYLATDGNVVTILPVGCLKNVKDAIALKYLQETYDVQVIGTQKRGTFPGSAATTALVRLTPKRSPITALPQADPETKYEGARLRAQIIRGACQMHRLGVNTNDMGLVHNTDIRRGKVKLNGRKGRGKHRSVSGLAIVIPRVGNLTRGKVGILDTEAPVMLSDCVIAIKPKMPDDIIALRNRIMGDFSMLRSCYAGTGAPFITVERLKEVLCFLGVEIE